MKKVMNIQASTHYSELFSENSALNLSHPAVIRMQALSDQVTGNAPTAIDRLEVYKECHRLADDLYRLTGSKRLFRHVMRIGDLLLSRIVGSPAEPVQVNQ